MMTVGPARSDHALVNRLNAASRPYRDPRAQVPWHELDPARPWLPERLISLYGLPDYDALSQQQKLRLSQAEFVATAELGLWLESLFLARVGRQVLRQSDNQAAIEYQLNELREEAGHSLMFIDLVRRSGFPGLTPPRRRPRIANLFARLVPANSPIFWAAVFIGEAVPDQFNRLIASDTSLPDAVRAIVALHRHDEARHIAYARLQLARDLPRLSHVARMALVPPLRLLLRQFLDTCFYPQAPVYRAAGLADASRLARVVRANPGRAAVVAQCLESVRRFLHAHGLKL
jgi:P-aminobenzoate N-oxygenase AurF